MIRARSIFTLLLCAVPAMASAFGLGQLELESGLNQPFEARIGILSATAEELSSLNIGLADAESFQRAGIDRPYLLTNLKFEVHETESGPDFIRVYSVEPIREPYLNFLLEAGWSRGRLLREYTVLLDPPLYDPGARRTAVSTPAAELTTPVQTGDSGTVPVAAEAESFSESTGAGGYSQGDYGPTAASDTLWSIAAITRPDDTVSVQQMMLALLRANPEAFADNNINGLKRGQILRMPERNEIMSLSMAEAMAEASAQNAMWRESQGLPAAVATSPASEDAIEDTGSIETAEVGRESSELRLLAASESGTDSAQGVTGGTGSAGDAGVGASLALANEQVETLSQENADLKSRLTEAETIIEDLRRLISLKDDELASIQQQVAETGTEVPEESVAAAEVPGAESDTAAAEQPVPAAGAEEVVAPEGTPAETETAPTTPEALAEPEPASVTEAPPPPAPAPAEAPQGMVDQILGMVMENLIVVGGGAAGIFALIAIVLFLRSRRKDEAQAPAEEESFAYTSESEEPTFAPAEEAGVEGEVAEEAPEAAGEVGVRGPAAAEKITAAAPKAAPAAAAPAAPAPAPAPAPEEDPLAEVNVFLAYEHFDQAEEFVRDAIAGNPDNLEFHTKLLEVFYASGDKTKYEAEARVLHDKVGGSGPHWDMTVAMWSEMSPNRALFEAGGEEEAAAPAAKTAAGGVFDLTAGESKPGAAAAMDMGLDFDLGDTTDVPAAKQAAKEEDVLDLTAAASIAAAPEGEDLLDVTAAVGLEPEPAMAKSGSDEMMLDITSGSEAPAENLLDISFQGGDNLLDVTSQADTGTLSGEEDLLDVTSATSAGSGADDLLEISAEQQQAAEEKDDNLLDFDIGGLGTTAPEDSETGGTEDAIELEQASADNVIEFDSGESAKDDEIALDIGALEEEGPGLTLDEPSGQEAGGGLELDLSISDADEPVPELELGLEQENGGDIEFDLTMDEAGTAEVESTMKMPELELETNEEEDDADDHTVFVPRSSGAQEQSAEDEVATKLDLAKAYVELGDKDSARGILEEIIRDGNPQQQATARDLLKQVK